MRMSISSLEAASAMSVVDVAPIVTLRAVPSCSTTAPSTFMPRSLAMNSAPVTMAMSCSSALRRSPKPGALIAATLRMPRSLLTTSVASASPVTSSAISSSGALRRVTWRVGAEWGSGEGRGRAGARVGGCRGREHAGARAAACLAPRHRPPGPALPLLPPLPSRSPPPHTPTHAHANNPQPHLLQDGDDVAHRLDLLVGHQHLAVVVLHQQPLVVGHKLGGDVAAVDLHALGHLDEGLGAAAALDRQHTVGADLGGGRRGGGAGRGVGQEGREAGQRGTSCGRAASRQAAAARAARPAAPRRAAPCRARQRSSRPPSRRCRRRWTPRSGERAGGAGRGAPHQ
jgi:hypothetical protein